MSGFFPKDFSAQSSHCSAALSWHFGHFLSCFASNACRVNLGTLNSGPRASFS